MINNRVVSPTFFYDHLIFRGKVEMQTEKRKLRVIDDKEDVIRILRHSTDGYNAVLQLVKEKYLTKLQAEAITNITFSQFAGLERNTLKQNLGDERKLRDFLVRLRIQNPQNCTERYFIFEYANV